MTAKVISKILEIDNCNKDILLEVIYKPGFWEIVSPVKEIEADFPSPNVLHTKIVDEIISLGNLLNIPIEMDGELVLNDKGDQQERGRLIEINVRNNKDIKELEGNLRIKEISNNKSKIGVFIHQFVLSSDFLNLIGRSVAELTLRNKITKLLRNLEKYCKTNNLKELL